MTRLSAGSRNAYIGVACALIGSIGFSGKTILIKLAYQYDVDVMTLLALRMLFAFPLFALMAWWPNGKIQMARADWVTIIALGFLGYYLGSILDFAGLHYISAGLGRLILYLYPTVVLILAALFLKQPIRRIQIVSLALCYGGIALVFQHEVGVDEDWSKLALGTALVFGSAVSYAIYLIAGGKIVVKLGSMRFTAYASLCASVFVVAHFSLTHSVASLAVPHQVYGLTLIMAVFSTVVPLWLTSEALKRLGASQTALVACIGPIATIALAHFLLNEPVTAVQLAGAALVIAGVLIISIGPRAPARGKSVPG